MFAKSFLALDGNGRLIGAHTSQTAPYDRYTCHLCGSILQYHPEYGTNVRGLDISNRSLQATVLCEARRLRRFLTNATPEVSKVDWHCTQCATDYL